ncbi:MAG: hypothetical protein ACM3KD_09205, partial [Hyphomicrobiaceae bacterium]
QPRQRLAEILALAPLGHVVRVVDDPPHEVGVGVAETQDDFLLVVLPLAAADFEANGRQMTATLIAGRLQPLQCAHA